MSKGERRCRQNTHVTLKAGVIGEFQKKQTASKILNNRSTCISLIIWLAFKIDAERNNSAWHITLHLTLTICIMHYLIMLSYVRETRNDPCITWNVNKNTLSSDLFNRYYNRSPKARFNVNVMINKPHIVISLQNNTYSISVIITDREGTQSCVTVTLVKSDIVKNFLQFIANANCFTIQFQKELDSSITHS